MCIYIYDPRYLCALILTKYDITMFIQLFDVNILVM